MACWGSLNDMYDPSAKTGSGNKNIKHFQCKAGALWIEGCC